MSRFFNETRNVPQGQAAAATAAANVATQVAEGPLEKCATIQIPRSEEKSFLVTQYNPEMQAAVEAPHLGAVYVNGLPHETLKVNAHAVTATRDEAAFAPTNCLSRPVKSIVSTQQAFRTPLRSIVTASVGFRRFFSVWWRSFRRSWIWGIVLTPAFRIQDG
jgi:hypothetical protein